MENKEYTRQKDATMVKLEYKKKTITKYFEINKDKTNKTRNKNEMTRELRS